MTSQINRIQLKNWKNHKNLNIKFEEGLNFIIGENGSGKTSIIEAILFGLTGRTLHSNRASFRNISTKSPANICINFTHRENDFEITRAFNDVVYHKLNLISEKIVIDKYSEIQKKIEDIFNSRIKFLEQMIYYGENEYFKSFQSDHKHQFRNYIENFMGIKHLEELRAKSQESNSSLKNDLKEFNKKLENISIKDEISYDKLKRKFNIKETERKEIKQDKAYFLNKLSELNKDLEEINRKIDNLDSLKKKIAFFSNIENSININMVIDNINKKKIKINLEIEEISSVIEDYKSHILGFEEEERIFKLVNEIIGEILRKTEMVDYCPLCKTGFKEEEFKSLLKDRSKEVIQKIEEKGHFKNKIFELYKRKDILKKDLGDLNNLRNSLLENKIYFENLNKFEELNHTKERLLKQKNKVEKEYKSCLIRIDALNEDFLNIKNKISSIEKMDPSLDKNLITYRKKRYNNLINLNKIIGKSLEKTLHDLRLKFLYPIMNEITYIWNYIFKKWNCEISFDSNLNPIIKKDLGEIDFKNLSGGEKTILLILTRSLILHNFSGASFLLLDEPLEHLDPENRRLIVKYLEDFCDNNLINQLIITTFEETLTRRLKTKSNVNLIHL